MEKRPRRFKQVKEKPRIDFVAKLFSKELVLKVFGYLSLKDLVQCAVVSLQWSSIANDEMLWKPLFINHFQEPFLSRKNTRPFVGSWKLKYKIHHNWLMGNCHIFDIKNIFANHKEIKYHLQFQNDTLFIANTHNSIIDVWKYQPINNSCIKKYQLQSIELAGHQHVHVTFLKFIPENQYLIAGYSNGGFTLWKLNSNKMEQVANYVSSTLDGVVSISMHHPIIVLHTKSMKLLMFQIHHQSTLRLIHCLQSPIQWSPIIIDIEKYSRPNQWRVIVLSGENSNIRLQEIVLSLQSVISSRQGFTISSQSGYIDPLITSMVYSPPYLITAHPNNTMTQYMIHSSVPNITFKQTLYGHTFKVDALSIDRTKQKLLSGDKSSIKIWDLMRKKGECQVPLYQNQSKMNELPNASIESLDFDEEKIIAIMYSKLQGFSLRFWSFNP